MLKHMLIKVRNVNLSLWSCAIRVFGKYSEAIIMYDRAIQIDPNHV